MDTKRRAVHLSALVEGNSIRATSRMTGAAKNTIVFVWVHGALNQTPAQAAGVSQHRWTLHEVAELPA